MARPRNYATPEEERAGAAARQAARREGLFAARAQVVADCQRERDE